jgi:hypothetical protein
MKPQQEVVILGQARNPLWAACLTAVSPRFLRAAILATGGLLLTFRVFAAGAQEPKEVPVAQEPSHHKVFENSYVRVFRVTIDANQSSLLHRHDLDYVYVSLGPADIINAMQGGLEIHPKLVDGQIGFAKGGFAHVATAVGIPFNNVTIELLHAQGAAHNLCDKVVEGPVLSCTSEVKGLPADSPLTNSAKAGPGPRRVFETDEIEVTSFLTSSEQTYSEDGRNGRLLVVGDGSTVLLAKPGESMKSVKSGEISWLEPGKNWKLQIPKANKPMRFFLIRFKDADAVPKP